jgi:uncharacterized protein (DUF58 family)
MFALPFMVGLAASVFLEVSEVRETLLPLLCFTGFFVAPVALAQLVGTVLKSRRDLAYWRDRGELDARRWLHVLYQHMRVVTLRGWMLLVLGLIATVASLWMKWASFGTIAVMALALFYLVTGWTVFVSTFLVRSFERGLGRATAGISRALIPAVCVQGERAEEVFTFRRVPVPLGYSLLVEDPLPWRLRTESRYVVGSAANRGEVEQRGRVRATPRGFYRLGPAKLWYQDLLGITRVSVASVATATLKVLPRFKPVEIHDPPRSRQDTPDVITKPHRFATEDHFRFREYANGDDTRRIHWRLSLKTGRLQVRQPETREVTTKDVLLVLDTYLPTGKLLSAAHGADTILDNLVDAWLGIARELVGRGDRVTLVAALAGHAKEEVLLEKVRCIKGEAARWQDMGARVRWQGAWDVPQLLAECGDEVHGVVVTARFTSAPPGPLPGQDITWLFMDPVKALGDREAHWLTHITGKTSLSVLSWITRLPHPAGSEDNALVRRVVEATRLRRLWTARRALRLQARIRGNRTKQELLARGDAVYLIEPTPTHVRLFGVQGQVPQARAAK